MSVGRRRAERKQELRIPYDQMAETPWHVLHEKLNALLAEGIFDGRMEELCRPHYCVRCRPSIPRACPCCLLHRRQVRRRCWKASLGGR